MTQHPDPGLVSVIVCVYNAGEFLRPAVQSLLDQTYPQLQIIVVDDGSTDDAVSTIRDLRDDRIEILSKANGGKPSALNLGLAHVRGEFYAVQDADDLSKPTRIAAQLACLQRHPTVSAVFCGCELILDGRHVAPRFAERGVAACREDIESMQMPGHDPTAMYRCALVANFTYDEQLPIVEGYDYIMRIGETADLMVVGECLYSYRIHLATVTKSDPTRRCRLLRAAVEKTYRRRGLPFTDADLPAVPSRGQITHRQRDNELASHFMVSVVDLLHAGRRWTALRTALACARVHPGDAYYYKPLAYALAPIAAIDWYRGRHDRARRRAEQFRKNLEQRQSDART
jgi:glycosyltransferase involved in cell wall biosynthesis